MHQFFERLRTISRILGLSGIFVFQLLCFHEGRDLWTFPLPVPWLCLGGILGVLAGALTLSLKSLRPKLYRGCLCLAVLLGALGWFWALQDNVRTLVVIAQMAVSLPLPLFLQDAFASQPKLGLRLGLSLGCAYLLWLVPTLVAALACLGFFQLLLLLSALLIVVALWFLPVEELRAAQVADETSPLQPKLARETFWYLSATMMIFFVLSGLWDWFFYRMHAQEFPVPRAVFLYFWLILAMLGFWLDRQRVSLKLIIGCFAVIALAPLLSAAFEGQLVFWLVYALGLTARCLGLLYFLLVFARFSAGNGRVLRFSGLVVAMPWLCLLTAYLLARQFSNFYVGIIPFLLVCMVFCFSFSFLASRVQYALTLSGAIALPKATALDTSDIQQQGQDKGKGESQRGNAWSKPHVGAPDFAVFARKYGISQREQEVLSYIVDGKDTSAIARSLFISENTVKTHVRQILRKTDCHTRIVLTSLFFREIAESKSLLSTETAGSPASEDSSPH